MSVSAGMKLHDFNNSDIHERLAETIDWCVSRAAHRLPDVIKIRKYLERYDEATEVVWLQEEPENMGAWSFVHARLHACLPGRLRLRHVSRVESASPAIGSAALHQLEQADLLRRAIG